MSKEPTRSANTLTRPNRILVVDDEEVVRAVVREVLDRPSWYVVEAADGEQAIGLLLSEHFDLLVADKNLPGITGLDVIRHAKTADERIGTLLMTAFASRESAEEALVLGVDDYITKPFDVDDLVQKVEQALDRRRLLDRESVLQTREGDLNARPSRKRILICDPQPTSRLLLEEGLLGLGHRVQVAGQVGEVIEALRKKSIDALVCDLDLLNQDDASACFLRSALLMAPDVKFVAVAASKGLEGAIDAIHRGADKVIYRPLGTAGEISQVLGELLDGE